MSVQVQSLPNSFLDLVLNDNKTNLQNNKPSLTSMLYLSIRPTPPRKSGPTRSGDDDDGTQPKSG